MFRLSGFNIKRKILFLIKNNFKHVLEKLQLIILLAAYSKQSRLFNIIKKQGVGSIILINKRLHYSFFRNSHFINTY